MGLDEAVETVLVLFKQRWKHEDETNRQRIRRVLVAFAPEWWECDGCGLVGSGEDVNRHIVDIMHDPKSPCWGSMLVGSPAWIAFHNQGRMPMQDVTAMMREALASFPEYRPTRKKVEGGDVKDS